MGDVVSAQRSCSVGDDRIRPPPDWRSALNIPLAIVLAVLASLCFALGATGQHLGVERNFAGSEDRAMTARRFLQLLVTPMWLGGTLLLAIGCGLHVYALTLGPLTVIQPVGILAVPFSILLANRIFHTRTTPAMWGMVAMTVVGIVAFTALSGRHAVEHVTPTEGRTLTAAGVVWVCAAIMTLLAVKGPRWSRNLMWAWAGAFLYGLGSALIKLMTMTWGDWIHPLFWTSAVGLALAYGVGAWMIQQAYATGPAEIVVGVMTTVDPVVAVAFGLIVLEEGRAIGLPVACAMAASAVMAAYGVFLLSKHHPDAKKHREAAARDAALAAEKG